MKLLGFIKNYYQKYSIMTYLNEIRTIRGGLFLFLFYFTNIAILNKE